MTQLEGIVRLNSQTHDNLTSPQLLGVCYESTFTEKLLRECKKATSKAVKPIDDIIKVGVVSGGGLGVA